MSQKKDIYPVLDDAALIKLSNNHEIAIGSAFPVRLTVIGGERGLPLTRSEAEALRDAIDELLNPPESVVRVKVFEKDARYGYRDPSGELKIGDLVKVPFGYANTLMVGRVIDLGRAGYMGQLKDVHSKFESTEL